MDDLGENKTHLYDAAFQAKEGDVLVDLGVRFGVSSQTMLDATQNQGCRVVGIDVGASPFGINYRYTFLQCDSVSAARLVPPPVYLVFFDTLHVKEHVLAELFHYWPKIRVGGYAVFHDSNWPVGKHDRYLEREWEQPIAAINEFFMDGGDNIERTDYPASWGMTFVKKLKDWNPIVLSMDLALKASKLLTESLFPR